MRIQLIKSKLAEYEVGVDNVTRISLTDHGSDKTIIYKIEFEQKEPLYVGMIVPHIVNYS